MEKTIKIFILFICSLSLLICSVCLRNVDVYASQLITHDKQSNIFETDYKSEYIIQKEEILGFQNLQLILIIIIIVIICSFLSISLYIQKKHRDYDNEVSKMISVQQNFTLLWIDMKKRKVVNNTNFNVFTKWGLNRENADLTLLDNALKTLMLKPTALDSTIRMMQHKKIKYSINQIKVKSDYQHALYFDVYIHLLSRSKVMICVMDKTKEVLLQKELQNIANKDFLSNTLTRRAMNNLLLKKQKEDAIEDNRYYVVLFDIDNFKQVNDKYGHLAGDKVLQNVSRIICSHPSFKDCTSRWGGEEFLSVIQASDINEVVKITNALLIQVENSAVYCPNKIKTTVSAGISLLDTEKPYNKSLSLADKALYQAKSEGKNCVRTS